MTDRLRKAQAAESIAQADFEAAKNDLDRWRSYSRWLAILMAAMLLVDAALLPGLVRRTNRIEAEERARKKIVNQPLAAGQNSNCRGDNPPYPP